MVVKIGDRGRKVKEIQTILKDVGIYQGSVDGVYGLETKKAVMTLQKEESITVDGIVGKNTYKYLLKNVDSSNNNTKVVPRKYGLRDYGSYQTKCGMEIECLYLDDDEYVRDYGKVEPKSLYIHHTSGWDNPYNVIHGWNNDNIGRIGTQYIIGGLNIKGNSDFDGKVVEAFPDGYIAWHLGKVGDHDVAKYSIGIELNNFGYLNLKNGKYYNYIGYEVPKEQVVDLGYEFRGYRYWHKYSDLQIENLRGLIYHIKDVYPTIDITSGLPRELEYKTPEEAFEFNKDVYNGNEFGIWTHTNVRKDKTDCSPQKKLIDMIKTIK